MIQALLGIFVLIFSNSSQLRICFLLTSTFLSKDTFEYISLLKKPENLKLTSFHDRKNITLNNKKPTKSTCWHQHFSKTPVAVAWCSSPAQAIHAVDASPERTHRRPSSSKIRVLKPAGNMWIHKNWRSRGNGKNRCQQKKHHKKKHRKQNKKQVSWLHLTLLEKYTPSFRGF